MKGENMNAISYAIGVLEHFYEKNPMESLGKAIEGLEKVLESEKYED